MDRQVLRSRGLWVVVVASTSLLGCTQTSEHAVGESSGQALSSCGQTSVTGVDVYHGDNNGNPIDWSAVKAGGASFAFAKATESTTYDDPMFATNWQGMKAAGLVRGAYHFFDPGADPTAQADFFLRAVGPVSQGDLLVLDFETSGGLGDSSLSEAAATFLGVIQSATGLTPLLYASSEFLSDWGSLGAYPLWVANYGVSCPEVPSAWASYTFWQSSGSGSAPGIDAPVDVDVFNGSLAQLLALGGKPSEGGAGGGNGAPTNGGSGAGAGGTGDRGGGGTGGAGGEGEGAGGNGPEGVACSSDGDCNPGSDGSGQICVSQVCVAGCDADWECPGNTTCVSGSCQ